MYELSIQNRGPEGVRGFKQFRLSKKAGQELHDRMQKMADGEKMTATQLVAGLEDLKDDPKPAVKADQASQTSE